MIQRLALLFACIPVVVGAAQTPSPPNLERYFEGLDGTFVVLNGTTGEYIRHNATRAAMARRVGMPAERQFVERFQYGNGDTRGGIDTPGAVFWLDGSLRISANEQVDFLRRFYEGKLGVSERTTSRWTQTNAAGHTWSAFQSAARSLQSLES